MDKLLNILFPNYIIDRVKSFIPKNKYPCLYCGHIYSDKNVKINNNNNCNCYYRWNYFHQYRHEGYIN